jgi:hypothetical protein
MMSKVYIFLMIGFVTLVSFQNCAKLKSDNVTPTYYLASQSVLGENAAISGAEYYTYTRNSIATSTADASYLIAPQVLKTKVDVDLKKNELSISKFELSDGGYQSRVYEVKTCKINANRMYDFLKSEIKKIKICTYVSTLSTVDFSRCPLYSSLPPSNGLADLQYYVNVQGVTSLAMAENSAANAYERNPYCDLQYTTYCNADDDAGRLKPVLDDILSEIETSQSDCKITNP